MKDVKDPTKLGMDNLDLDMTNSMARIQQAIEALKENEDPLTPLFDTSKQNSGIAEALRKQDEKRKAKQQKRAMAIAQDPRAEGLKFGAKKAPAVKLKTSPSKLSLGSL